MMNLGNWALKNRKLIYFLVLVMMVGGGLSYYNMSKLEDPEIMVKQAMVVTTYPGASAHQVELEVTDIIEKSIRSMNSLKEVTSRSMGDVSMISVELSTTVANSDVQQQWDILRRKVNDIQSSLPSGASTSIVMDNFGDVFGMFYAMTFDGYTFAQASKYAELVQREIQEIEGISQIGIYGDRKECINIELFEDRVANMGVHPAEVLATLNGQNQAVYSGYYESGDTRIRVAVNDRYRTVDDIGNLLLQGHEDDQLRLKDIALIKREYEEPLRNQMHYDGAPAIGISIAAKSGTDITKLGELVDGRLEALKTNILPVGIEFEKVFYQPTRVTDSLGNFILNLIESIVIVILVLMLTMGFRSGIIIGTSLLVTVFGSLMILNLMDGTLQRISLAAFILAMGMLVDNSIVVIDGILVDIKAGKPRRKALTEIGKKTAMPLLGATLIAILAFLPIYMSPDTAGVYIRDLFIVLAISLLLSWVLALTLVPIQANAMLALRPKPPKKAKKEGESFFYRTLRRTLEWMLGHKTTSIVIAVGLLAISMLFYKMLPQGFFPDMHYDQLYVEYKLPEGYGSNRVRWDISSIEKDLLAREDVTHVTSSVGGTASRYNLVRYMAEPSMSYGELIVDFTSSRALLDAIDEIQQSLTANYPDAYVRLKRYNLMYKKYPVEVQFKGPDPAVLRHLTAQAQQIMSSSPDLYLITGDWEPRVPVLTVDYNQPIARRVGLTRQDVGLSLLAATDGIPTTSFYDGNRSQTIYLKSVDREGNPIESLENAPIFGMIPSLSGIDKQLLQGIMSGSVTEAEMLESSLQTIPLSQVSKGVKVRWEDPAILRHNGQRVMRAQANTLPGMGVENSRQGIVEQIEKIELPAGYTMEWEGEYSASRQSMKYLFKNYPLAIMLMLAILIMLFKDYRKPLIIICCIPLMMIGVIFGVYFSGKTFNFVAIVAALGLIGMIVKNGIVLMDEIAEQIANKVDPYKALLDSTANRFRPVMMASLTTILGMIPLLSDELFGPGAVTIMSGLLVSTMITLLFVPILYAIFFKIKPKTK